MENDFINTGFKYIVPTNLKTGDTFPYGDYEYHYNEYYDGLNGIWTVDLSQNGWGVRVINDNKKKYEQILETIAGKPVVSCNYTFCNCKNLIDAPAIPKYISKMEGTFMGCEELTSYVYSLNNNGDFTDYTLPHNLVSLPWTFYGCKSLLKTPKIPSSVINMDNTFAECSALFTSNKIPNSVLYMDSTFKNCEGLFAMPVLGNKIKVMKETFSGCTKLITLSKIPDTVKDMFECFKDCPKIKRFENIPDKVENMDGCFANCIELEQINNIPLNIKTMKNCFLNCKNLEGRILINTNFKNIINDNCFLGTEKNIHLDGSSEMRYAMRQKYKNITI